jgi:hypothetical protein
LDFFKTPVAKMVPCGNLFEVGGVGGDGWLTRRACMLDAQVPGVLQQSGSTYLRSVLPCCVPAQIVAKKVYLAVPSECPVGPDGKARKAPGTGISGRSGAGGRRRCRPAGLARVALQPARRAEASLLRRSLKPCCLLLSTGL